MSIHIATVCTYQYIHAYAYMYMYMYMYVYVRIHMYAHMRILSPNFNVYIYIYRRYVCMCIYRHMLRRDITSGHSTLRPPPEASKYAVPKGPPAAAGDVAARRKHLNCGLWFRVQGTLNPKPFSLFRVLWFRFHDAGFHG